MEHYEYLNELSIKMNEYEFVIDYIPRLKRSLDEKREELSNDRKTDDEKETLQRQIDGIQQEIAELEELKEDLWQQLREAMGYVQGRQNGRRQ